MRSNTYSKSYDQASLNHVWINDLHLLCLLLQDDHEITIEELEMRYNTSVTKVKNKTKHKT